MSKHDGPNRALVVNRDDGWAVVRPKAKRASATTRTQAEDEARAREIVRNLGGGEVTVQRRDGNFPTQTRFPRAPRRAGVGNARPCRSDAVGSNHTPTQGGTPA